MVWFLLVAVVVLLWLSSLCKIVYCAQSQLMWLGPFTGDRKGERGKNILLVIAHPDDESMFFSPTIIFFTSAGYKVHILCISTGNADGKGEIRKQEILRACVILKVPPHLVEVLDHPDLQDGFGKSWNYELLAGIIDRQIAMWDINMVITFDKHGVSGHPNHCDVHHGLCKFLSNSEKNIEAWALVSTNILRKYSGPLDIWLSIIHSYCCQHSFYLVNHHALKCYNAMAEHYSQWVWFRRLFVLLSSYTYINTVQKIHV